MSHKTEKYIANPLLVPFSNKEGLADKDPLALLIAFNTVFTSKNRPIECINSLGEKADIIQVISRGDDGVLMSTSTGHRVYLHDDDVVIDGEHPSLPPYAVLTKESLDWLLSGYVKIPTLIDELFYNRLRAIGHADLKDVGWSGSPMWRTLRRDNLVTRVAGFGNPQTDQIKVGYILDNDGQRINVLRLNDFNGLSWAIYNYHVLEWSPAVSDDV